jgi:hypothetical protein
VCETVSRVCSVEEVSDSCFLGLRRRRGHALTSARPLSLF